MTWQQKTIARILLILARMIADPSIADELKHLSNHINGAPAVDVAPGPA